MKLLFIFLFSAITVCAQVPEWSRKYHTGSVTCLDFSSDGKLLLSGGEDGQIFLNDVIRGLDIRSYPPTQFGAITSLHFSSDGRQFIASAIKYHDGQKFGSPACLKANIQGQDPLQLLFKPDNLLYNDNGKDIRELNNIDRLQMYLLGDSIICVLMSGEITGTKENSTYKGQGGLVHLYSASTGMKKKEVLKETLAFDVISASADLRRIYVAGKYSLLTLDSVGGITRNLGDSFKGSFIYNIQEEYSQKDAFPVFHGSWIEQASFIENGLLIQNTNGYIYTKGINQDTSRMEIPNVSSPTSLATVLATDIKGTFYITAHHDSTLRLWSPGVRNIFKKILLPSPVTAIAISSDSIHFATGHSDGTLALWNIDSLSGYAVTDSVFTPVIARVSGYYTYCVGENAKFDVIAQSNFGEELLFQWKKKGDDLVESDSIVGVHTSSLVLKTISKSDSGAYSITVSTTNGSKQTISLNITVNEPPHIIEQLPSKVTLQQSAYQEIRVLVADSNDVHFQWYKNNVELPGETKSYIYEMTQPGREGVYTVKVANECGSVMSNESVLSFPTSVADNSFKNTTLSAEPNPFKSSTTIRFSLPSPLKIRLTVTDILGREVAVVKDEFVESGEQSVVFNNEDLPDGMYFLTLTSEKSVIATQPIMLQR